MNAFKIGLGSKALLCAIIFSFLLHHGVAAQDIVPGEWIIQLKNGASPEPLMATIKSNLSSKLSKLPQNTVSNTVLNRIQIERVSNQFNIWLLKVPEPLSVSGEWIGEQREVKLVEANQILTPRSMMTPNDPLFQNQWQYQNTGLNNGVPGADLHAIEAWNYTTGGISAAGDTIVVAVIDGGVANQHPDLSANLWKNWKEKPGDGQDNDNNGFVDDFLGWNVFSQNDQIQGFSTTHGTPVCGIVGAQGNNNTGITGVNWNVKIMFVAGGITVSSIISAYDYVINARKRYNETNGAEGAFVVAVNSSWGIDFGTPIEAPLWCQIYDELGSVGILGVAATANMPVNVDVVGDLPTTCPSNYLLSVSSITNKDLLANTAAWGETSIDLASYGEEVYTLTASDYGNQSGTSFAAPHVAGAIALLYASPCPELIALSKIDPAAAALEAKTLILQHTTSIPDLAGITVSGGKLNLGKLIQTVENQCPTCPKPYALQVHASETNALLTWFSPPSSVQSNLRWRAVSDTAWNVIQQVQSPYNLSGLQFCAPYEFAVQSICGNEVSEWTPCFPIMTEGCCSADGLITDVQVESHAAKVTWSYLPNYSNYKLRIRQSGTTTWQTIETTSNSNTFFDLISCTSYECLLLGYCIDGWVELANDIGFHTSGCGACLDVPYCSASADQSIAEWIQAVQIGNWLHESGLGGNGFQDFTGNQLVELKFYPFGNQQVILTPGFLGATFKEYFRIYIDFNQDGDFLDADELAFDPGYAQHGVVNGELIVPGFSQEGLTRMRVLMKYGENNQPAPTACESFIYGQVEDYCATLSTSESLIKEKSETEHILRIYPQPAQNWAWVDLPGLQIDDQAEIKLFDLSGKLVSESQTLPLRNQAFYVSTAGIPPGVYLITLRLDHQIFRGKLIKE